MRSRRCSKAQRTACRSSRTKSATPGFTAARLTRKRSARSNACWRSAANGSRRCRPATPRHVTPSRSRCCSCPSTHGAWTPKSTCTTTATGARRIFRRHAAATSSPWRTCFRRASARGKPLSARRPSTRAASSAVTACSSARTMSSAHTCGTRSMHCPSC